MKYLEEIIEGVNPDNFIDFSKSYNIPDSKIGEMILSGIKSALTKMIDGNLDESFFSASKGNFIVFGEIYKEENTFFVEVSISKNYKSIDFTLDVKENV